MNLASSPTPDMKVQEFYGEVTAVCVRGPGGVASNMHVLASHKRVNLKVLWLEDKGL